MTGKRPLTLLLAFASAVLVTGCGGATIVDRATPENATAPGFPVTMANCGVTTTYERPPRRAVSLNQHATEVMLALGLEKSMIGTGYLDDRILPEYRAAYDGIKVLSKEYPSYEALLAAEPDFVYGGFATTFDEKEGRGRTALAGAGIDTYLNIEECASTPVTLDMTDQEIRNVAKIFGVPDRAEREVRRLHTTLDAVGKKVAGAPPVKLFVYDSGDKTAFTAGGAGVGNEMIKRAGGANLFADLPKTFGDVSFEQVAERAPEVIVIYDYGDQPVEDKKRFLLSNPALKDVPAIKNKRFAVLPLSSTVLGVRVPAGVESLARQIHPDRFR
ncbi:lipoprotein [Sphaerisporangium siamense]|uniref:Iron complex transport system substrate-binding protein n=1 Tax=Sphaerisporangium siamense TaxID=795645 RepID=A0A7W7D3B1_9ACTN|nr:ABC transporter substrate-binding protein [Sphaerisporangium siamense]MBB4699346.1 iron complex transport system substrate-binding protein [Sphaerisporangium siamense]GII89257.1 lipoprotein [Sphaerisporangium siamense]